MTPYQGDTPDQRQGQQSPGNEYQPPPTRQPWQPPTGQPQGYPPQQGQNQQTAPQGQVPQTPPRQQTGTVPSQLTPQGTQRPNSGMQPQQARQPPQTAQQVGIPPQRTQSQMTQTRMRPIRIEEIVETDVVTAQRETPIETVVAKMAAEDVGSVVVVENDQPVGVITDRAIALALENTPDVATKQAGELISGDLVTATTNMSVFDALDQLNNEKIRRLPIVGDDGRLQGIVTLDDILVLLGSELNKAGETIRAQSPRL